MRVVRGIAVGLLALVLAGGADGVRLAVSQERTTAALPLSDWQFRAWRIAAGGAHPLAQLPDDTLVIGTETGVARFDGHRMSMLPLPTATIPAPVKLLFVDAAGTLHIVCVDSSHLCVAAADAWVCTTTGNVPAGDGDSAFEPTSICEDRDGIVWIGHRNGLVSRTSGRTSTWLETAGAETSAADAAVQVATDASGRVWMARKGRLAVWDAGRWDSRHVLPDGPFTLAAANDGGLWLRAGGDGQVSHFSEGDGLRRAIGTDVPSIRVMHEDATGRLWMATWRLGLVVWDGKRLATAPTNAPSIYSVLSDREGVLWVGTPAGLERGAPRIVRRIEMATSKPLRSIRTTAAGDMWFITLDGELGCRRRETTTFPSRRDEWKHGAVTAISTTAEERSGSARRLAAWCG